MEGKGQQWIRVSGSYKGRVKEPNSLCMIMIWCWELPEEEERRPCCFVDFWRKPPPLIGFGVERHTLAYRRYHPGISSCISGVFCEEGAAWPRRAQAIGEILRSAVDRGPDCRSISTQWRASQGASIETVFIRFRRWNLAERPIQLFRAHAFRIGIWLCMQGFFIRSGQILPTHFTTGRGDRFELHSDRFRRWNLLGRIQCPRRGANPPGFQI